MRIKNIIRKIETTLIGAFACLDEWFDDAHFSAPGVSGQRDAGQILEHVMLTNRHLLKLIRKAVTKAKKRAESSELHPLLENYRFFSPTLDAVADPDAFPWE